MSATAEFILNNSDLLVKEDCVIIDGVLYEYCRASALYPTACYRYFMDVDDYDYLERGLDWRPEDADMIERLNKHFNANI